MLIRMDPAPQPSHLILKEVEFSYPCLPVRLLNVVCVRKYLNS